MDAARMVREVRRRQRWSQRELALHSGVGERTVARIESGERRPTTAVLEALVRAGGLELVADTAPAVPDEDVRKHLVLSLTQRLHLALGGDGRARPQRAPATWQQLCRLTGAGRVVLHDELAMALWLPPAPPPSRLQVCLTRTPDLPAARRPSTPDIDVVEDCRAHPVGLVEVSLECWRVHVEAPADLALLQPAHRYRLLAVAELLHDEAARDVAGRRVRAHADPRHAKEKDDVFHTKRYGSLPMPPEADRRGWRLDDDASLPAWLRRYGYPT